MDNVTAKSLNDFKIMQ